MTSVKTICAALGGLLTISGAVIADAPPTTVSPLRQAKTIIVHEDVLMAGQDGKMHPFFHESILIRRPNKVHVIVERAEPGTKPHLYVADGKIEREYNALTNTYNTVQPRPDGRSASQLRDISQIDTILNAGPAQPEKGIQRTVGTDTLDGRAIVLTTDTSPARDGHDGSHYASVTKTWVDAVSGLPFRAMEYSVKDGGAPIAENEHDFSGWALNQPIPAARMAWAIPAGAKPYSEPSLLAVGTPAPDFTVTTSDGKTVHLSDYKGKTVILDFWATWCGPCQASMPHLERVYQQVKDKNVAVLAVCVWDQKDLYDKWVPMHIGKDYNFPVAFDPAGRGPKSIAGNLYKVTGIPTQYVIDKDGKVAASGIGYDGDDDHRLEANLAKQGIDIAVPAKTASTK